MNHYDILAVPRDASLEAIRASYTAQLATWSTSADPLAEQRRHQLQSAYVVLTDAELRATYDDRLAKEMAAIPMTGTRMPSPNEIRAYENQESAKLARDAFAQRRWAGFWFRFGAQFMDGLILFLPSLVVMGIVLLLVAFAHLWPLLSVVLMYGAYAAMFALYNAWLNSSEELSTWGRRAAGIVVVSELDGEPISFGRAFARGFLSYICAMLIFPNLLQLFTARRQSLPDLITGTVVVRKHASGGGVVVAVVATLVGGTFVLGILAAIAIPAYQDYTVRARVTEGMSMAKSFEALVEKNAQSGSSDLSRGFVAPNATPRVTDVAVSPAGIITVQMGVAAKGVKLSFYPSWVSNGEPAGTVVPKGGGLEIKWACQVSSSSNNRYVAPECRV